MTINKSKISIIVPIYNIDKYLDKCINSIIMQTYTNLQIILVDDGSTDDSGSICDQFILRDHRIEVYHTRNRGLVGARKFGLEKAKGEYIGFVDGDDYIESDMFFVLMENIVKCNADFVHSGYIKENNQDRSINCNYDEMILETNNVQKKEDFLCKYVLNEMSVSPSIWSKLFKADFIKKCYRLLPDTQQYGEDMICLCRCILESQCISLSKNAMYHYRVREHSLSHIRDGEFVINEITLWGQLLKVFDEYGCFKRIKENISFYMKKRMLSVLLSGKDIKDHIPQYFFKGINQIIGKKVVIYGAGRVGQDYYAQICKYMNCDIIAWIDSNWSKYHFEYADVMSTNELKRRLFDIVVIAVYDGKIAQEIRDFLVHMGIAVSKIIWVKPGEYF